MKYKQLTFGDIAKFSNGKKKPVENGRYKVYGASGVIDTSPTPNAPCNSIIIGRVGTCGSVAFSKEECWISDNAILAEAKDGINTLWLYYALTSSRLPEYKIGSTQPLLTQSILNSIKIKVPDLETQKKIVRILSALDSKIEFNTQQNEKLSEIGKNLYIEKFENNENIERIKLGEFFKVLTGKKDANASLENGKYPFFTCSKSISKIGDYSFDTDAILLAGNGDFNVKFYRGKFDAYQRTYVLAPNNKKYLGFLYWAISYNLPKITANYRGSVIKFITKGNIENFEVPFEDNKDIHVFMRLLEKIEINNKNNDNLVNIRDTLLPKLMNGEINLEEVDN